MIAVCPNPYRDIDLEVTEKVIRLLRAEGYKAALCRFFDEDEAESASELKDICSLTDIAGTCSLVIVIGGDGTILSAVRALGGYEVPILGINMGTKGFMATLEADDLPLILKAARGECDISRRMMLDVELIRKEEAVFSVSALNDVVIHGHGDCIKVAAYCDGSRMTSYSGDGIILATPTGSTGYSLSAGGPLVEPDASNIIVSPICAHILGSRPFVLNSDRVITVKAEKLHGRKAYISTDGMFGINIENGDRITVKKSKKQTLMVDIGLRSFYEIARDKLI